MPQSGARGTDAPYQRAISANRDNPAREGPTRPTNSKMRIADPGGGALAMDTDLCHHETTTESGPPSCVTVLPRGACSGDTRTWWMAKATSGPDWFELHNSGDHPVALGGLFVDDSLNEPGTRPIPALSRMESLPRSEPGSNETRRFCPELHCELRKKLLGAIS